MRATLPFLLGSFVAIAAIGACTTGGVARPGAGETAVLDAGVAFAAEPPSVYVAKVKNVLTGLPPTKEEVLAVTNDPTQLPALVDQWMKTPEYEAKMLVFFELAFQQTQISTADFTMMLPVGDGLGSGALITPLVQNLRESFARTVLSLVDQGRPFTDAMTTTSFMMTPPLMELYAFMDAQQVDDNEKVTDHFRQANTGKTISVGAASGPIPYADSINPASPNYLRFYVPDFAKATTVTGCTDDPRPYPPDAHVLHELIYGTLDLFKGTAGINCGRYSNVADAQLQLADFAQWKMVSIRPPKPGEATTPFYDVAALRSATELVLTTPRVGFFSTPAFFANWQTNTSNQMRVTLNQSLIVATGMQIDGADTTSPPSTPGLDAAHAAPGTSCFGCHQTLDPTRAILQSTYSYGYGAQTVPALTSQKGLFAFQGVITPVASVGDFGGVLAKHPALAAAWAQKLCYYVNSQACEASDPEFARVVAVFAERFSWNDLVRELVSSPLTTHAAATRTAVDRGEIVAVARRDHLCALLDARLGLVDVCGLDVVGGKGAKPTTISQIAAGLPSDGYGRGAPVPVLPTDPTLFFRAATENICEGIAAQLVDATTPPAGARTYSSAKAQDAIADLVANLMALDPTDPRAPAATAILQAHFADAQKQGASPTDALRSTFVLACLAPSVVGMGM